MRAPVSAIASSAASGSGVTVPSALKRGDTVHHRADRDRDRPREVHARAAHRHVEWRDDEALGRLARRSSKSMPAFATCVVATSTFHAGAVVDSGVASVTGSAVAGAAGATGAAGAGVLARSCWRFTVPSGAIQACTLMSEIVMPAIETVRAGRATDVSATMSPAPRPSSRRPRERAARVP